MSKKVIEINADKLKNMTAKMEELSNKEVEIIKEPQSMMPFVVILMNF